MKTKQFWIAFALIGAAGTLLHFFYEWSGENPVVGIFSAKNESVWEHLKLLFFPALVYAAAISIAERRFPRGLAASAAGIYAGMAVIPVSYYTYSGILGRQVHLVNIALLFAGILAFLLVQKRLLARSVPMSARADRIAAALLLLTAVLFGVWSYFPPALGIFSSP